MIIFDGTAKGGSPMQQEKPVVVQEVPHLLN
jgi:hypothetical protein